jgi:hypothetical protein
MSPFVSRIHDKGGARPGVVGSQRRNRRPKCRRVGASVSTCRRADSSFPALFAGAGKSSANPQLQPGEIADLRSTLRAEVASQELDALFVDTGGATI